MKVRTMITLKKLLKKYQDMQNQGYEQILLTQVCQDIHSAMMDNRVERNLPKEDW